MSGIYAGATATRTGAHGGASNNVVRATLRPQVQAICGLGDLTHVGAYRPQLRFYASATTMAVRLTFQALDGPMRSLSYKIPVVVGWNHVDLGLVTIPEATQGAQRWTGRIEAYSTATGGETLDVDAIWFMPAEQYGRSSATYAYRPGGMTGYDDFTGTTAGAALNARVAPIGGTWATSGATSDFVFVDPVGNVGEAVARTSDSQTAPRYAILGSTNYTDTEVGAQVMVTAGIPDVRLIARYVDANNYLAAELRYGDTAWRVFAHVGGVTTELGVFPLTRTYFVTYKLRLVVFASGQLIATLTTEAGAALAEIRAYHASLATGGALATGKPGLADENVASLPSTRYYDGFYSATPPPEPIVCHSGQSITFASDGVQREDATGTYAGSPPEYVGAYPTIPNAGGPGRKTRIAVIARRNDVTVAADDAIVGDAMDLTTVTVYVTPHYLAIPR